MPLVTVLFVDCLLSLSLSVNHLGHLGALVGGGCWGRRWVPSSTVALASWSAGGRRVASTGVLSQALSVWSAAGRLTRCWSVSLVGCGVGAFFGASADAGVRDVRGFCLSLAACP